MREKIYYYYQIRFVAQMQWITFVLKTQTIVNYIYVDTKNKGTVQKLSKT